MKKILKIGGIIVLVLVLAVTALLAYVSYALPAVDDAPDLTIEATPERLARGKYLATAVAACLECHSKRDFSKFAGPIDKSRLGEGGELFGTKIGFPGDYYSRNITPAGIGEWTDGELFRAITTGVSRDGHPLFSIMPYTHYGKMDKEDIYSIIAFLRTIQPVENDPPLSVSYFPMNFIINTLPKEPEFVTKPSESDQIKYGEYLANAAVCMDCHTMQSQGVYNMEMYMAGGFEFPMPGGTIVRSANITPDKKTGLGNWTEDQFVARFKMYSDSTYSPPDVKPGEFNTMMPWNYYTHIAEKDLRAIFAYLQSIPAIENQVIKFDPPK